MFRRLHWIGSSRRDFYAVPAAARDRLWLALVLARIGDKHSTVRALGGCGDAGIFEIAVEYDGFAYWLVYSACYTDAVYVLHCSWHHPGEYKDLYAVRTALQEVSLFKRGGWHEQG